MANGYFFDDYNRPDGPVATGSSSSTGDIYNSCSIATVTANRLTPGSGFVTFQDKSNNSLTGFGIRAVEFDNFRNTTAGSSYAWFGMDSAFSNGFYWLFDSSTGYGNLYRRTANSDAVIAPTSSLVSGVWTNIVRTFRLEYNPATGIVRFYENGALRYTSPAQPLNHGGGANAITYARIQNSVGTTSEWFDNVSTLAGGGFAVPILGSATVSGALLGGRMSLAYGGERSVGRTTVSGHTLTRILRPAAKMIQHPTATGIVVTKGDTTQENFGYVHEMDTDDLGSAVGITVGPW